MQRLRRSSRHSGRAVTVTGADSAKIVIRPGQYGGVYLNSKSQGGKTLDQVAFGFTSTGDVQGGAPRFSLPIDDPATAVKGDGYAFIDAANCGARGPGTRRRRLDGERQLQGVLRQ